MAEERPVHISLKNFKFHNGIIIEVNTDFLIIIDEKHGQIPIYFNEVYDIEPREEKEDGKRNT